MTHDEARALAIDAIRKQNRTRQEWVILDEETMERPYGWIFFYQTRLFVETGNFIYALGGNGPVVVERENGRVSMLGTSQPLTETLAAFEAQRGWLSS